MKKIIILVFVLLWTTVAIAQTSPILNTDNLILVDKENIYFEIFHLVGWAAVMCFSNGKKCNV